WCLQPITLHSFPTRRSSDLKNTHAPVLGMTGTGGAGKSSLTDELIRRFMNEVPDKKVAIISIDPTKRKTGGALLGDRIRMNAIRSEEHTSELQSRFDLVCRL